MGVLDSLERMKEPWLLKVSHHLARGEELRENITALLEPLYDLCVEAVKTGNPGWLNTFLDEWVRARTETEFDLHDFGLMPLLSQILRESLEAARENLEPVEALAASEALIPVFLSAIEYTSRKEMTMNIDRISGELAKITAQMERLDRTKSDFIAIAAHELKTPLTLIEGYAAMLRDQVPATDSLLQSHILLKGVDNGTRRLREIVDDMIDVSLIDNNLLSLNFQPIWINRLLDVLKKEVTSIIADRRLSLVILPFSGSEEMTFGDGERLYQALRNVLSNAIKYTPDGGKITVDGRKLPGFVEIIVTDSGIGIDPDDHARIFEKFGRLGSVSLHSSGKTKFKGGGPGLGLPITKGIIEAHGGAIWVESEGYDEDRCPGATFHIMLPIRKEPPDDRATKLFHPITEEEKARTIGGAERR